MHGGMDQEAEQSSQPLSSTTSFTPSLNRFHQQRPQQASSTGWLRSSSAEEIPLPPIQAIQRSVRDRNHPPMVIDLTGDGDQRMNILYWSGAPQLASDSN